MKLEDAAAFANSLPGVSTDTRWGNRTWVVGGRAFAWQRPFSKADIKRFGDEGPPEGDILAVKVESLDAKEALLAIAPRGFFTIPHFEGYAAVLIALRAARAADVRAALEDAHRSASQPAAARAARPTTKPKPKPKVKPKVKAKLRASGAKPTGAKPGR